MAFKRIHGKEGDEKMKDYRIYEKDTGGYARQIHVVHHIEDVFDFIRDYTETVKCHGTFTVTICKGNKHIGSFMAIQGG